MESSKWRAAHEADLSVVQVNLKKSGKRFFDGDKAGEKGGKRGHWRDGSENDRFLEVYGLHDRKGRGMAKLNKMAMGLIAELASIRDELGVAITKIEGEGRGDVIHAHGRLVDLTGNVTLLVGQFNLKNLLKFLKRSARFG